jgi:hypothetical protein
MRRMSTFFALAGICAFLGPIILQVASTTYILDFNAHEYVWHNTLLDLWAVSLLVNFSAAMWHRNILFLYASQILVCIFVLIKCIFVVPIDGIKLICLIYLSIFSILPSCIVLVYRVYHGEEATEDEETSAAERDKLGLDQSERLLGGGSIEEESEVEASGESGSESESAEESGGGKEHASFSRLVALGK